MPDQVPAKESADARLRRQHAARIASGLCTRCGKAPPESGLKVCGDCAEKRRAADKSRRDRARARGASHAGRDPVKCRRAGRAADRRRRRHRREAGLCTRCGRNPPAEGRAVCEPCGEAVRAKERTRYAARRAAGACVRCGEPAVAGSSRCARHAALEAERVSTSERRSAVRKRRYARRRARGQCVDCGVPSAGAARCPACAYRSNTRAPAWRAWQPGPPFYTVIELDNGADHGTFDTEAETAACLVFLGLRIDQVEIVSNVPLMAPSLTGVP